MRRARAQQGCRVRRWCKADLAALGGGALFSPARPCWWCRVRVVVVGAGVLLPRYCWCGRRGEHREGV